MQASFFAEIGMDHKLCRKCKGLKLLSEFTLERNSRDGFSFWCRECKRDYFVKWYIRNPGYYNRAYHANIDRKRELGRRYYHERKMYIDLNKQHREYMQRIKVSDPDRYYGYVKSGHANYRARKVDALGNCTPGDWRAILSKYDYRCVCCGEEHNIEADHIVPLSIGGTNYPSNLQPLCRGCNAKKHARYIDYRPDAYWSDWT